MPYLIFAIVFLAFSSFATSIETLENKLKCMSSIHTLKSDYKQTRIFRELDFTMVSTGSFAHQKGKALIWRTETPVKSAFLITSAKLEMWDGHSKKVTTIKKDKLPGAGLFFKLHDSFVSGRITELKNMFKMEIKDNVTLELTPLKPDLAIFFKLVTLKFKTDYTAVEQVTFTEKSNDTIVIDFFNTRINPQLSDSTWILP